MGEADRRVTGEIAAINAAMVAADKRYEQRFIAQQEALVAAQSAAKEAVAAALLAADRAVSKADLANEKRFDSVNKFRATLADQASQLMPRIEAEARISNLAEKLDVMGTRLDRGEGNASGRTTTALANRENIQWVIGLVVLVVIGVLGFLVAHYR
jgi:hypothetical protein